MQQDEPRNPRTPIADIVFSTLPRAAAGALMICMIAVNFANVVSRHYFDAAIFWSEEVLKLMMIWGVYTGAIAVTYNANHLKMDLLSANLPRPLSIVVNVLIFATLVFIGSYVAYHSWQVMQIMHMTGRVSDALKYPVVILDAALFVGFSLMICAAISTWRKQLHGPDGPT